MEDAPLPSATTSKGDEIITYKELDRTQDLYEIKFLPKVKAIIVKCSNTEYKDDKNEVYSYKLTKDEITQKTSCYSLPNFLDKLKANLDNMILSKSNNSLLLRIFLDNNKNESLSLIFNVQDEEEEEIDENINDLRDAIKVIKLLIKENKIIKLKVKAVERDFKEYRERMEKTFLYNSFDINAYKLDDVYNNISSKNIIQNKREFSLINQGIQHLFKKNLIHFEMKYESFNLDFEYELFKQVFDECETSIIVILTQDKKRFGAFFKQEDKTKKININNNIGIIGMDNNNNNNDNNNNNNNNYNYNLNNQNTLKPS